MPRVRRPVSQGRSKARRTLDKSVKLFLARAKKEISRFGYGLLDAAR